MFSLAKLFISIDDGNRTEQQNQHEYSETKAPLLRVNDKSLVNQTASIHGSSSIIQRGTFRDTLQYHMTVLNEGNAALTVRLQHLQQTKTMLLRKIRTMPIFILESYERNSIFQEVNVSIQQLADLASAPKIYFYELFRHSCHYLAPLLEKLRQHTGQYNQLAKLTLQEITNLQIMIADLSLELSNSLLSIVSVAQKEITFCQDEIVNHNNHKLIDHLCDNGSHSLQSKDVTIQRSLLAEIVSPPLAEIEKILFKAEAVMDQGETFIRESHWHILPKTQQNPNYLFYTPDKNVRAAIDKIEDKHDGKVMKRTVSYSKIISDR